MLDHEQAAVSKSSAPEPGRRYKRLLFINDYPPSGAAGAPIFAKQLFREYDMDSLDVVHSESWPQIDSCLPCRHHGVRAYSTRLRPRRVFMPIESTLNVMRLHKVMDLGRRIAKERRVEAIFTTSYGAEMPHAAYFLSKELGLPFYYIEMDRLDAVFESAAAKRLIMKHRADFLRHVSHLWVISPAMARELESLYGVRGEAIHHCLDIDHYQRIGAEITPRRSDTIQVVFTGTILLLLYDAMEWFCKQLHRGITIGGRTVELSIYSQTCPAPLHGPHVHYRGFVPQAEVPKKIAESDIGLVLSGFDVSPGVRKQIETSVSTKTVDYLAAGRPVLAIATRHSGQVDYYGSVCAVVDQLDPQLLTDTLRRLTEDRAYTADLCARGLEFVRQRHSLDTLRRVFLSHFLV
jgi:glycosyltransferase involved in cell wall biosynthesis